MANLFRRGIRSLIRTTSAVDNPPSGQRALLAKSDGWYDRDSTGVETKLGAGGGSGSGELASVSLVTTDRGEFDPYVGYSKGDTVRYRGQTYVAKAAIPARTDEVVPAVYVDGRAAAINSANQFSITIPTTALVGDLMVMTHATFNTSALPTITGGSGSAWTVVRSNDVATGANTLYGAVLTRTVAAADIGATLTITNTNAYTGVNLRVFRNAALDTAKVTYGAINSAGNGSWYDPIVTPTRSGILFHSWISMAAGSGTPPKPTFDPALISTLDAEASGYITAASGIEAYTSGASTSRYITTGGGTNNSVTTYVIPILDTTAPPTFRASEWDVAPFSSKHVGNAMADMYRGSYGAAASYLRGDMVTYNGKMYAARENLDAGLHALYDSATLVGSNWYDSDTTARTNTTMTIPATAQAGDRLLLWVVSTSPAVSISLPSGWTSVMNGRTTNATTTIIYALATKIAGATDAGASANCSASSSGTWAQIILAFRGGSGTLNLPTTGGITAVSPAIPKPLVNPVGYSERVIACLGVSSPSASNYTVGVTLPSGMPALENQAQTRTPPLSTHALMTSQLMPAGPWSPPEFSTTAPDFLMSACAVGIPAGAMLGPDPTKWVEVPFMPSGGGPTVLMKRAEESRGVSTLTLDADLRFAAEADTLYAVDGYFMVRCPSSIPGLTFLLDPGSGGTAEWTNSISDNAAATNAAATINQTGMTTAMSVPGSGNRVGVTFRGYVRGGSSGGIAGLSWCQTSASPSNATILSVGSWLRVTRI